MVYSGLKLLLGVSSSIAAYRALDVASTVVKGGGAVQAVLTPNTTHLVGTAAFDAITGRPSLTSLWQSAHPGRMDHLENTKWANTFAVAPATAATIARLAHGLADDALSTLAVAWPGQLVIAPAMNPTMYQHVTVQENLAILRGRGHLIVEPGLGPTACGDQGKGRLADVQDILISIVDAYRQAQDSQLPDLSGRHLLITSGPTREFADPVRCITNPSTGRMGLALARKALQAGAKVSLVTGPCELPVPDGLASLDRVESAVEMRDAVLKRLPEATDVLFAAAVSDWKPAARAIEKAKKETSPDTMNLELVRTPDIALEANTARRPGQRFVGFAAESEELVANARQKMERKGFDLIVANPVNESGAGFASDTNRAVLLTRDGEQEIPSMTKDLLAARILRALSSLPCGDQKPAYPLGLSDA